MKGGRRYNDKPPPLVGLVILAFILNAYARQAGIHLPF